jgi:hypothetical protein
MAKSVPKNAADLQRLLYDFFPDADKAGLGLNVRKPNTVAELVYRYDIGERKNPDYVMPYLFPSATADWVQKQLPPLSRKEPGVVKVSDVVKAMWLMIYRGPIVNLAKMHKVRVGLVKKALFGEGGKKIAEKALARKIGVESAKELMKKLFVVKALLENIQKAQEDEDVLRSAAARTVGDFIGTRLAYPKKYTRFTRSTRTRK